MSILCVSPLTKRDVRVTFIFLRAGPAEEKMDFLGGGGHKLSHKNYDVGSL